MATERDPRAVWSAGASGRTPDPILQPCLDYDAAQHLVAADAWWRDCADRAIDYLAASGQPFTAADLTELGVPAPDHPNRWGALFQAAYRSGRIVPVGYARSTAASRHAGVVRVWCGVRPSGEVAA